MKALQTLQNLQAISTSITTVLCTLRTKIIEGKIANTFTKEMDSNSAPCLRQSEPRKLIDK